MFKKIFVSFSGEIAASYDEWQSDIDDMYESWEYQDSQVIIDNE